MLEVVVEAIVDIIAKLMVELMLAAIKGLVHAIMEFCRAVLLMVLCVVLVLLVVYLSMYSVALRLILSVFLYAGSITCLLGLIVTVFERGNQGPTSWRQAAYAHAMISAVLFTFADWAWKSCFGLPPFFSQVLFASCCVAWASHQVYMVFIKY